MNPYRTTSAVPCPAGHTAHAACFCGGCPRSCCVGDKMTYTHYKAMVERRENAEGAVVLESPFEG